MAFSAEDLTEHSILVSQCSDGPPFRSRNLLDDVQIERIDDSTIRKTIAQFLVNF